MQKRVGSRRTTGINHADHMHASAVVTGAAVALCFSLALVTMQALTSDNFSARTNRWAVVQEVPVEEVPADSKNGDSGYDEADQRREAERNIKQLREQFQNRERELKQNFRGVKVDLSEINAAMARWKEGIDALARILSSGSLEEFWNVSNDFYYDYQQPVDEAFQRAYDSQIYVNLERQLKDFGRQLKSMKSDLKRFQKDLKGAQEVSALEEFVKAYESNLATLKGRYTSLDRNDTEAAQDFQLELNETLSTQEFYDITQDLNDVANAAQAKREAKRQVKDIARSMKDQERQVKKLKKYGSTAELEAILAERKAFLPKLQDLLTQDPFDVDAYGDASAEMSDLDQRAWEIISELSEQENLVQQGKNAKQVLREKQRNLKEVKRECKRAKCQGTPLEEVVREFEAIVAAMKSSALQQDYNEFWDFNSDADDLAQTFWEDISARNLGREVRELEGQIKNTDRMLKDLRREAKRGEIDATLLQQVEGASARLKAAAQAARKAYDAKDEEGVRAAMEDANDAHMELSEYMSALEGKGSNGDEMEVDTVLQEIGAAERRIRKALTLGEISSDRAQLCIELMQKARGLIAQMVGVNQKEDAGKMDALQEQLEPIGEQINAECGDFLQE